MSTKKYLSLDEAAQHLGLRNDELNRLREQGQVRGFADRGTWKFKVEDVEELARTRQHDSSPEVPLYDDKADSNDRFPVLGDADSALSLGGDSAMVLDDDGQADDPTVIRKSKDPLASSDSDVRLVFDEPMAIGPSESASIGMDSDSDVRLVKPTVDSDSDVKLIGELDSDSDVKLVGEATLSDINLSAPLSSQKGSDSDIRLLPPDSDSNVRILGHEMTSDSDVQLLGVADSSVALDFTPDDSESASVLSDESGLVLGGDSAMMLAAESGITLQGPSDSGLSLSADADEGITLDTRGSDSQINLGGGRDSGISLSLGDSGISLESVGDSGISLEENVDFGGTIPMMDIAKDLESVPETKFEIPAMQDDSAYELKIDQDDIGNSGASTQVLNLNDSGESTFDDAVFDVDDDGDSNMSGDDDDLEVADDAFADDDGDMEDVDVFDADDGAFDDDDGAVAPMGGGLRGGVVYEQEWGTGTVVGLFASTVVLSLCMFLMFDLVKTMWVNQPKSPVTSSILNALGSLYGS